MKNIKQGELFCQSPSALELFYQYLPPKPYCTEYLGSLKIRPKEIAVRDPYIQPNPITRAYWMVFDVDSGQDRYWPDEKGIPTPNIEAVNRANDHRHLFYLIDPAVYTLRQARRKPLELAADVDKGLTQVLGADPGYGKLLSKNPLSPQWAVWEWHCRAWGLTELLDYIPASIKKWVPKPNEVVGLGRNCTVFDKSRVYAYSEWRRQGYEDPARLFNSVYSYSMNINNTFSSPMIDNEVRCIARSISKWTSRHISQAGLREWGDQRRQRSIAVRNGKSQARAEEIRRYKAANPGATTREIGCYFEVSAMTVSRALQGV
jgi:hypothetical protein